MRPVNLIPPEQRRGERAPLRSGPLSYLVVGVLAVALLAVTALVLTGNQVKDREAEVASLEVREAEARARAESLSAFAQFASLSEARFATVSSLARSRFNWERVLRELALVIPDDVWLVSLNASVSSEVAVEGGGDSSLRGDVEGPALSIVGCGESHEAVAGFIEALKDVDGVTRVGIASSELGSESSASSSISGGGGDDCRTREFISRFEAVAAFDEVEVEVAEVPVPAPAAPPAPEPRGEEDGGADGDAPTVVSGVAK